MTENSKRHKQNRQQTSMNNVKDTGMIQEGQKSSNKTAVKILASQQTKTGVAWGVLKGTILGSLPFVVMEKE